MTRPAPGNAAEPFGGARPCTHADRDGKSAYWLPQCETYQAETGQEPEAGA